MSVSGTIRALVTRAKKTPAKVEMLAVTDLPKESAIKRTLGKCDVLVEVDYSTLNYKDALVASGNYAGLKLPMVGGIDLAGTVKHSDSPRFAAGDKVFGYGWGMGTDHFGSYAEMASVRSQWLSKLEPAMRGTFDAASIGTAGYTAMLCIDALIRNGLEKGSGPVLVTGATGGVGSIATAILSHMGQEVVALSGKADDAESKAFLTKIGAAEVRARSDLEADPKPLAAEVYAGCVDTVGGKVLANAVTMAKYGSTVAACGLAGGMGLGTTVAPFILRGVQLAGIESVFCEEDKRSAVLSKYTPILMDSGKMELVCGADRVLSLEEVPEAAAKMLKGNIRGRYAVSPKARS